MERVGCFHNSEKRDIFIDLYLEIWGAIEKPETITDTQAFTKDEHQGKTRKQRGSIILYHSFTRIFALIYISVNSKHYHAPRATPGKIVENCQISAPSGEIFWSYSQV